MFAAEISLYNLSLQRSVCIKVYHFFIEEHLIPSVLYIMTLHEIQHPLIMFSVILGLQVSFITYLELIYLDITEVCFRTNRGIIII